MRLTSLFLFFFTLSTFCAAQNELGSIVFPVTGKEEAQSHFRDGVLFLHSFEYADAREAFERAVQIDPNFAMAYWGAAMTHTHPIWMEQDLDAARAVLNRLGSTPEARRNKAVTEREKAWLHTIEVLYGKGTKEERDFLYEKAMESLAQKFPDELEATAFHALAILGTAHKGRDFQIYMRAAGILEEVYQKAPDHPGVLHYMIHCYDDPVHATLGLRPARKYAKIAPAAAHALHMPSHIFLALGLWDDVVSSNDVSWKVAEERVQRKKLKLEERGYHYLFWLEYGYLQQGRLSEARKALAIMEQDAKKSDSSRILWHLTRMRAAYMVEAEKWEGDVLAIPLDLSKLSSSSAAVHLFVNGYAALQRKDPGEAKKNLAGLRNQIKKAATSSNEHQHGVPRRSMEEKTIEILEQELDAAILFAEGKRKEAVDQLKKAADAEAALSFEFGPPEIVKPTHELLGEMLLQLNQPDQAQLFFETALERAPRRVLSLKGLATAAAAAGNDQIASRARNELKAISRNTSGL